MERVIILKNSCKHFNVNNNFKIKFISYLLRLHSPPLKRDYCRPRCFNVSIKFSLIYRSFVSIRKTLIYGRNFQFFSLQNTHSDRLTRSYKICWTLLFTVSQSIGFESNMNVLWKLLIWREMWMGKHALATELVLVIYCYFAQEIIVIWLFNKMTILNFDWVLFSTIVYV